MQKRNQGGIYNSATLLRRVGRISNGSKGAAGSMPEFKSSKPLFLIRLMCPARCPLTFLNSPRRSSTGTTPLLMNRTPATSPMSLASMRTTNHDGRCPPTARGIATAATRALSARGSRIDPNTEVKLYVLAMYLKSKIMFGQRRRQAKHEKREMQEVSMYPSNQSDAPAAVRLTRARSHCSVNKRYEIAGVTKRRPLVIRFGIVKTSLEFRPTLSLGMALRWVESTFASSAGIICTTFVLSFRGGFCSLKACLRIENCGVFREPFRAIDMHLDLKATRRIICFWWYCLNLSTGKILS